MDFEKIVAECVKAGMSREDIAKAMTAALNEPEQKKEDKNPRDLILESFQKTFDTHYKGEKMDLADVGALLTLCIANDTEEGKKMDFEEITDFFEWTEEFLNTAVECYKISKSLKNSRAVIVGKIKNVGDAMEEFLRSSTDRKDEHTCTCGEDKASTTPKTDEEKIEDFLRKLFDKH